MGNGLGRAIDNNKREIAYFEGTVNNAKYTVNIYKERLATAQRNLEHEESKLKYSRLELEELLQLQQQEEQ